MGFFARIGNLIKGFFSLFISDIEKENPDIVYESAISQRVEQYKKLTKAVSGIVYLRNKLQKDLEEKTAQVKEITAQIPVAVQSGEDEVATTLIEQKNTLNAEIEGLQSELQKTSQDAEDAKKNLITFQGEIEKLKREKESMIAKKETAEARIKIQEQLDGLSTDADIKALDGVRDHINKLQAEADVTKEVAGGGLSQKLKDIKAQTTSSRAKAELEEMKRQMQAQRQAGTEKSLGG